MTVLEAYGLILIGVVLGLALACLLQAVWRERRP